MSAFVPHSSEWFDVMQKNNPLQAAIASRLVAMAGHENICSTCGDPPVGDYQLQASCRLAFRLCEACRLIYSRTYGNGMTAIREQNNLERGAGDEPGRLPKRLPIAKQLWRAPMGMSEFIKNNQEPIVAEWETFARSIPCAEHLDQKALRNQTYNLLTFIAEDMKSSQTAMQQSEKAKGRGVKQAGPAGKTAKNHAEERFLEGFDVVQLMSEFRALRASVTRLLEEKQGMSDACQELNRFHESIDQLLMESLVQYNNSLNRRRDLFLGMLVHDMRNPLGAISNAAQLLPIKGGLNENQSRLADQIARNTADIVKLVSELVDVTRSTLGRGIPISPEPIDLADILRHAVQQARLGNSDRTIILDVEGNMNGQWDAGRISQLASNLIGNALKHGASDSSIKVTAKAKGSEVILSVHNEGEPIPADLLPTIFDAMARGRSMKQTQSESSSLGLGLFISKEIVTAHGGKIYATSTKGDGTTFVVWLPREAEAVKARQKYN